MKTATESKIVDVDKEEQPNLNRQIGPKMKTCFIVIWAHTLFLTWLVLDVTGISLKLQAFCLAFTMIVIYLHLLLMQDYFYLKTHKNCANFRKDIKLIKPLFQKEKKK